MGNYTELIKSELFEGKWGIYDTSEDEYSEIIEYLNSSGFRTFGDGLTAIISQRVNEGETILECLKRCFKEKLPLRRGSKRTPQSFREPSSLTSYTKGNFRISSEFLLRNRFSGLMPSPLS